MNLSQDLRDTCLHPWRSVQELSVDPIAFRSVSLANVTDAENVQVLAKRHWTVESEGSESGDSEDEVSKRESVQYRPVKRARVARESSVERNSSSLSSLRVGQAVRLRSRMEYLAELGAGHRDASSTLSPRSMEEEPAEESLSG